MQPPSPLRLRSSPCCGSTPGRLFHRPSLSELFPTSRTPRNTPHDLVPPAPPPSSPDPDPKFRRSESACRLPSAIEGTTAGSLGCSSRILPDVKLNRPRDMETPRLRRRRPGPDCRPACMPMEGKASKQVPCVHIPRNVQCQGASFWCFCVASLSRSHFPGNPYHLWVSVLWGT